MWDTVLLVDFTLALGEAALQVISKYFQIPVLGNGYIFWKDWFHCNHMTHWVPLQLLMVLFSLDIGDPSWFSWSWDGASQAFSCGLVDLRCLPPWFLVQCCTVWSAMLVIIVIFVLDFPSNFQGSCGRNLFLWKLFATSHFSTKGKLRSSGYTHKLRGATQETNWMLCLWRCWAHYLVQTSDNLLSFAHFTSLSHANTFIKFAPGL